MLTAEERTNLVRDLRRHRDWAQLWRVALDLPVDEAVTALRPVRWRWRPADKRDRELFTLLTRTKPKELRRAHVALDNVIATPVTVRGGGSCYPPNQRSYTFSTYVDVDGRPLVRIAQRPQATWTPDDHDTVRGTRWIGKSETRVLEDVLRACLDHRFGD